MRPKRRRRIMMKVEGTETVTETPVDNSNKTTSDVTEGTFDSTKTVKNEDDNNAIESILSDDIKVNNGITDPPEKRNEIPGTTKEEDISKDSTEDDNQILSPVENKCENVLNDKKHLEDTKNPFKICRLCLVFVDDNFIPLEKVMVMLQIVLPEVVRSISPLTLFLNLLLNWGNYIFNFSKS